MYKRQSKNKDEVIVRFPDVATRDAVRSAAFHLAGKNAGLRLEIPDTLRPSLRALESVAYNLKRTNPGMRRNVKFDDEKLDVVMDVRLNDSGTWKKIRPGQAMAARVISGPPRDGEEEITADELQNCMSGASTSSSGSATGANAAPLGS